MEALSVEAPGPDPVAEDVVETYVPRGPAAYIAELVGTFMLVFVVTMVVSMYVFVPTATSPVQPFIDWSVIGLVHAFILFMLIQTLGVVSGAHLNPAVTISLAAV